MFNDYFFEEAISEVKDSLDKELQFYGVGDDSNIPRSSNLENLLQQSAASKPPEPKNRSFFGTVLFAFYNIWYSNIFRSWETQL